MVIGRSKKLSIIVVTIIIVLVISIIAGRTLGTAKLPEGFASGNGRIEATEVNIATKLPGRLLTISAEEGDLVQSGQILARMDTKEIDADLRGAQAQLKQAEENKKYAQAIVTQQKTDLSYAEKQYKRAQDLVRKNLISKENLDLAEANYLKAQAAFSAASFKVEESKAAIEAAQAKLEKLETLINESVLKSPVSGRVLYRLAEPGEVLPAGGNVLTVINLKDVYMTIFLPTTQAGKVALSSEARIILDSHPEFRIPAKVFFVAPRAQFTPKEVETKSERDKLMFRIKVRIPVALLEKHIQKVKTGITGMSYIRLDPKAAWPEFLQVKLPE